MSDIERRVEKLEHEVEELFHHHHPHHHHGAAYLKFVWDRKPLTEPSAVAVRQKYTLFKENPMSPTPLTPGQSLGATIVALDAKGNPTNATINNVRNLTSSDPTTVSIAPDPANPNRIIVTVAPSPATVPDAVAVSATADATDSDGTVHAGLTGQDTVSVVAAAPPPPPPADPAASVGFQWDAAPLSKK